jgi:flavin-dependent dehydrogenase
MQAPLPDYDVIIVGGAFSGASLGLLLKRARPETRVLIVERAIAFDRKVGESTSEVAATFLTRILRISPYLNRHHLAKQGLRMWFTEGRDTPVDACTEIGALYQSRLPAYQIDRSHLDEHLLELAVAAGCHLWRPARLRDVVLHPGGLQEVSIEHQDQVHSLRTRWIADASGKAAWLARKLGHWRQLDDHPTRSLWARFRKVRSLDSYEVAQAYPQFAASVRTARDSATNHLMGRGWWCWIIPLKNGDVSLGLTYDSRLFAPASSGSIAEKLLAHVREHPVGRLLFEEAEVVGTDMRAYAHLPYHTAQMCGDGWASVGDAAGFMDPLYSQGLDYCSHTVFATHKLILESLSGAPMAEPIAALNTLFQQSYQRWFQALYQGKYHYLGDAELMNAAFLMDLACYFLGPVRLVHENPESEYALLPYAGPAGQFFARFMRFYNRRLARIACRRWEAGVYGKQNTHHRFLVKNGFVPAFGPMLKTLRQGLTLWLKAECKTLFLPRVSPAPDSEPSTVGVGAAVNPS